jgi:hypothetical protein
LTAPLVQVLWSGSDCFKAYFDPDAGLVEVVSNRPASGGVSLSLGEGLVLSLDDEEHVVHLSVAVAACADELEEPLDRPGNERAATFAEVEIEPDLPASFSFDRPAGVLRVQFRERAANQWGRIGSNLIWLALDEEQRLAGVVIEGVSLDPGGVAQLRWLQESTGE